MKLSEIAARISAHLKRRAGTVGPYVSVRHVDYQGSTCITKAAAEEYLAWLEVGNVGTYFQMLHEKKATKLYSSGDPNPLSNPVSKADGGSSGAEAVGAAGGAFKQPGRTIMIRTPSS